MGCHRGYRARKTEPKWGGGGTWLIRGASSWRGGSAGIDTPAVEVGGAGGSSFISGYPGAVALSDTSAANSGTPRMYRPATDSPGDRLSRRPALPPTVPRRSSMGGNTGSPAMR